MGKIIKQDGENRVYIMDDGSRVPFGDKTSTTQAPEPTPCGGDENISAPEGKKKRGRPKKSFFNKNKDTDE